MTSLLCPFCGEAAPRLADQPQRCPNCGAAFVSAASEAEARQALGQALGLGAGGVELAAALPAGNRLAFFGWNPAQPLSALQVAFLTGKSKQVVQTHLREGRFAGARKVATPRGDAWEIPYRAVQAYLRSGRKKYTLSEKGRKARAKAARERNTN